MDVFTHIDEGNFQQLNLHEFIFEALCPQLPPVLEDESLSISFDHQDKENHELSSEEISNYIPFDNSFFTYHNYKPEWSFTPSPSQEDIAGKTTPELYSYSEVCLGSESSLQQNLQYRSPPPPYHRTQNPEMFHNVPPPPYQVTENWIKNCKSFKNDRNMDRLSSLPKTGMEANIYGDREGAFATAANDLNAVFPVSYPPDMTAVLHSLAVEASPTTANPTSPEPKQNDIYLNIRDASKLTEINSESNLRSAARITTREQILQTFVKEKKSRKIKGGGSIALWHFLLILLSDDRHSSIIEWEGDDGTFILKNSMEVARLWGMRKNNHKMNYEKLSRGLRYYYDKQIVRKVSEKKHCYKFNLEGLKRAYHPAGVSDSCFIQNHDSNCQSRNFPFPAFQDQ